MIASPNSPVPAARPDGFWITLPGAHAPGESLSRAKRGSHSALTGRASCTREIECGYKHPAKPHGLSTRPSLRASAASEAISPMFTSPNSPVPRGTIGVDSSSRFYLLAPLAGRSCGDPLSLTAPFSSGSPLQRFPLPLAVPLSRFRERGQGRGLEGGQGVRAEGGTLRIRSLPSAAI